MQITPKSPKTILAIASQVDRCEATLLSIFAKLGITVILVGDQQQRYADDLDDSIKIIPLKFKSRLQLSAVLKIRNLIKTIKPDIIHLFSARSLSNTLIASIGLKTNLVAYRGTMGHLSRIDPSSWLSFLNPKLKKIICVSHAVEKYLWQQGVPASRTVTIHKGHKFEWYSSPTSLKRNEFGIPNDAVVISCVANVRPVKGVDFLIKAFSEINLNNGHFDSTAIYLLLIGELRDDKITNLIQNSPNKQNIICTGFRKDATDIVALADIFVMPSVAREGLPKALIESMAKGISPIVTDVGGMPEVVIKDVHGLVVAPSNVSQLKDAIICLIKDKTKRQAFSAASVKRIQDDFVIDVTAEKTLNTYSEILST